MQVSDAMLQTYQFSRMVLKSYVSDLSDEELLTRPHQGCNHIAWQLGHLIASEVRLLESVAPGESISLPDGFADAHDKANIGSDAPDDFNSKDEYLGLFEQLAAAFEASLKQRDESDFDKPGPEFLKGFADTVGAVYLLIATHPMMHVGQFVPVRRELGKPIVI